MREIKFRSWNPEVKKMYYDFDQNIKEVGLGKSIHSFVYNIGLAYGTLMQFTGLKDKNGREIYEGDIVEHITGSVLQPKGAEPYGEFWRKLDEVTWPDYANVRNNMVCIIGNIFENPELLEKIKENNEKYPGYCPFCHK